MPEVKERPPYSIESKANKKVLPFALDGDFCFTKGVKAFKKSKFELAAKWIKRAIEVEPEEPLYQCQLSIIYTEIGLYHRANELLIGVLKNSKYHYPDCYYLLANNYAHLGLLNEARKNALQYLEECPDGDVSEEAKDLLELINIEDEDDLDSLDIEEEDELLVYQETAFRHMEYMEWDKALPVLEEMLMLFPQHTLTTHDYSQALFNLGSKEEAIERENNNLNNNPNDLYSHMNLAVFYYEIGEKELAEACIEPLLHLYPMLEQQKLRIAVTLAKTNYLTEAKIRFRKLKSSFVKSHPSYYRWYAFCLTQLAEEEHAKSLWAEGLKRHPELAAEKVKL